VKSGICVLISCLYIAYILLMYCLCII
jgi:hypothetical protein